MNVTSAFKRGYNAAEPVLPEGMPECPAHLSALAREEWHRLAAPLHAAGVLTLADRAAMAAYCQAYGRWVEAEEKLQETPMLIRTPSGYVQQSPWLSVANKQMELMGRYMAEIGLTPASRSRVASLLPPPESQRPVVIRIVAAGSDGQLRDDEGNVVTEDGSLLLDSRL